MGHGMSSARKVAAKPPPIEVLQVRAEARANLWWHDQMELDEAVDGLQEYAERSGLVAEIGQDAVQELIAAPFAQYRRGRAMAPFEPVVALRDDDEADLVEHQIHLDAAALVRRWEAADPRDNGSLQQDSPPYPNATAPAAPLTPRQLQFTSFAKIQLSTASRYLIKGILPNVGLVVVWGAPKCGKSFFVFDMVAHVAAGWEYRGRRVKQRAVVYFALEGQEGFVARIEAFRQVHCVSDIPFYLSADRIVLPQDGVAVVRSIKDQFPDVKPGIVVLDTLNRSISGSENDPSDMGQYVRAADLIRAEFGCIVIVIHHCGVEGGRPRGHTSLTGAADAQIAVRRNEAEDIVATVEFMKDGPQGETVVSSLEQIIVGNDNDGDAITSCVVRPAEGPKTTSKSKVSGATAMALRILHDTIIEEGEVPLANTHIPPNTRTIPEKTWRENCYARMSQDDTTQTARQKAFVRASNALQAKQLIGKYGDHIWLA
jgi:hypothetical protein